MQNGIQCVYVCAVCEGIALSACLHVRTYVYSYITTRHFSCMSALNTNVPASSGLPKDHALSLSNTEWKERAVVKLTIEEVFSNILRVTVRVERQDAVTNDLTVSIDAEALVSAESFCTMLSMDMQHILYILASIAILDTLTVYALVQVTFQTLLRKWTVYKALYYLYRTVCRQSISQHTCNNTSILIYIYIYTEKAGKGWSCSGC